MIDFINIIYLSCYFTTVIYFVALGTYMLTKPASILFTNGEYSVKTRMTHNVGGYMIAWALQCLFYLPVILIAGCETVGPYYDLCFLLTVMINTPAVYVVMYSIVQKKFNMISLIAWVGMPFLVLLAWFVISLSNTSDRLPVYLAAILVVVDMAYMVIRYVSEYRVFVRRLRSEYSDITCREIGWAWYCFAGFVLQSCIYLVYQFYWSMIAEYVYMVFSIVNATYLCFCVCRQKPIDESVVEQLTDEQDVEYEDAAKDKEEKAFYGIVEKKLSAICEERLLFLESDLTRETLCLRLGINRTYLSMYLRSRGITFYQYINRLRIDYAVKLMEKNPTMSVRKVSTLSGFKSQTTFRKVFQEEMGCLPSDMKIKKSE